MTLSEVSILETWQALGGGKLRYPSYNRHKPRGVRFWLAKADGYNISFDLSRNVWHDFVSNEGGGVLKLVERVRDCNTHDALGWLEHNAGLTPRKPPTREEAHALREEQARRTQERERAHYWSYATRVMLESRLAELPRDCSARRGPTWLLQELRKAGDDAALVELYLFWRREAPTLTEALVFAGRRSERRLLKRIEYTFERLFEKSSEAA